MKPITQEFKFGNQNVKLETGVVARQADGAVMVTIGETVVLVTAVARKEVQEGQNFLPLTVNYQEKTYAAGKIPGGYFKREGRPTELETLVSRLIDRPLRPLFPKSFYHDTQVIATVISHDCENDADIAAMLGASAALMISGVPFEGPIAAARVGYIDGKFIINPTFTERKTSDLDLVVAGTKDAILMVESEAKELPESTMLEAVMHGHKQMQVAIEAIEKLAKQAGKPKWGWVPAERNQLLADKVAHIAEDGIRAAYKVADKMERDVVLSNLKAEVIEKLCTDEEDASNEREVCDEFSALEKSVVRSDILAGNKRIDGRDNQTVRPITIDSRLLPRVHGSALFTRGETQAVVAATLGSERDARIVDNIWGEEKETFMLHYNFPPYCVGETGFMSGPKRREIGHGNLAKRGLQAVMPTLEEFPYTIRVVSEITESNGSSSMASVCGTSLALMDAGVPVKAPVSGVAMGLVKEGDDYVVLTDIMGSEDHLGDMDFKVAGTAAGVTALQMDIKISGLTQGIMFEALEQANKARMHILGEMNKHMSKPKDKVSKHAPCVLSMSINPDKIRDVIGRGGATIRELTEETGTTIDITDEGLVKIWAPDGEAGEAAKKKIEDLTAEAVVGEIYEGKIAKILDFGAFVNILPGQDGLLHISQISEERIENIHDHLDEGQMVKVKVLEIDRQGRIKLSMKAINA